MPDPIIEHISSREATAGQNPSIARIFKVWGTEDEVAVGELVQKYSPLFYDEARRIRLLTVHIKPEGGGVWICDARYGLGTRAKESQSDSDKPGKADPIGPQVSIDIGSENQHITQSLKTTATSNSTGDPRTVPNYKGAICVSREGGVTHVKGCEVPMPKLTWSETWTFNAQWVTWGYVTALNQLVGRKNFLTFRTWNPQEVMFMGANITPFGENEFKIVFHFARSPTVISYRLQPDFTPVDIFGWQFTWADYDNAATADSLIVRPRGFYVEEVGRPGVWIDSTGALAYDTLGANSPYVPTNMDDFTSLLIGA